MTPVGDPPNIIIASNSHVVRDVRNVFKVYIVFSPFDSF